MYKHELQNRLFFPRLSQNRPSSCDVCLFVGLTVCLSLSINSLRPKGLNFNFFIMKYFSSSNIMKLKNIKWCEKLHDWFKSYSKQEIYPVSVDKRFTPVFGDASLRKFNIFLTDDSTVCLPALIFVQWIGKDQSKYSNMMRYELLIMVLALTPRYLCITLFVPTNTLFLKLAFNSLSTMHTDVWTRKYFLR